MARLAETPRGVVAPRARWALVGLLALTVAGLAAGAASFARPQLEASPSVVTFPLADVPEVEPVFFRPFDMGESQHYIQYGIYLVRDGEQVLALHSRDLEHPMRCAIEELPPEVRVRSEPSWFTTTAGRSGQLCPGRSWSRAGVLLIGAPRDMDRFDTRVIDGVVHVDVSRLRIGDCPPPTRVWFSGGCPYSTAERPLYRDAHWPAMPRFWRAGP